MKRKKAMLYHRSSVTHPAEQVLPELRGACRKRRFQVIGEINESALKQRRLYRLLSQRNPGFDVLVLHSLSSLPPYPGYLKFVTGLLKRGVDICLVRDGITLSCRQPNSAVMKVIEAMLQAEKVRHAEKTQCALILSDWCGVKLGRPRIAEPVEREVRAHLKNGMNPTEVHRRMNGKVSRASIIRIKKRLGRT